MNKDIQQLTDAIFQESLSFSSLDEFDYWLEDFSNELTEDDYAI